MLAILIPCYWKEGLWHLQVNWWGHSAAFIELMYHDSSTSSWWFVSNNINASAITDCCLNSRVFKIDCMQKLSRCGWRHHSRTRGGGPTSMLGAHTQSQLTDSVSRCWTFVMKMLTIWPSPSCCCFLHSPWCRFKRCTMFLCIFLYEKLYICTVIYVDYWHWPVCNWWTLKCAL